MISPCLSARRLHLYCKLDYIEDRKLATCVCRIQFQLSPGLLCSPKAHNKLIKCG